MPIFTAVIPAAGSGVRMKSSMPKQYLPLCGIPVLAHTLRAFDGHERCVEIVIATSDRRVLSEMLAAYPCSTPVRVVDGGARRQDSVFAAVNACPDDDSILLIHDAARPLISREEISAVLEAMLEYDAALLAVPVTDTIKMVHEEFVVSTPDRRTLWIAQTPQAARAGQFRKAFRAAASDDATVTDDAAALEHIGVRVAVVRGSGTNMKITTEADLAVAESILRRSLNSES